MLSLSRLAAGLSATVLAAAALVAVTASPALATCITAEQHVTGTDGNDYIVSPRPINGGTACLTLGTGASYQVFSQGTAERTDHKVLSYPDELFGCQWGGTNNVDLDCTSGFTPKEAGCYWESNPGPCGHLVACSVLSWSSNINIPPAVSGTNSDEGFDLWFGSASTPDWAHTDTEIFVNTNPDQALGTGYTSWPSVTIGGASYYYHDSSGSQGAWTGNFVQYIRHINKDGFTNFDLSGFMSDAFNRGWLTDTDYTVSIRAGQEIEANGAGIKGGEGTAGDYSVTC